MKLGIALDDVFCQTRDRMSEWEHMEGNTKFLQDSAFWGGLQPYGDTHEFGEWVKSTPECELYVFATRPKSMFLCTRTWIRNNTGLVLDKDHLLMQALKRYDCRLRGIQHFIDTNPDHLENLKLEAVFPIKGYLLDRERDSLLDLTRKVFDEGNSSRP